MKKDKQPEISLRLVDASKKGTIIVGCPRLGTHFLQNLCVYHAEKLGLAVIEHGEIVHAPSDPRYVDPTDIHSYLRQSMPGQYRLLILNHLEHKVAVTASPAVLEDWHVVRVRDPDAYRWFWSWFLFIHLMDYAIYPMFARYDKQDCRLQGHPMLFFGDTDQGDYYHGETCEYSHSWSRAQGDYKDASKTGRDCKDQLGHHGTWRQVYVRLLAGLTARLPLQPLLMHLPGALHNHLVSQILPADQELEFKDLPQLANHVVEWLPNDYPQLDLGQVFENADLLAAILDRWSGSWPGVFKEKQ